MDQYQKVVSYRKNEFIVIRQGTPLEFLYILYRGDVKPCRRQSTNNNNNNNNNGFSNGPNGSSCIARIGIVWTSLVGQCRVVSSRPRTGGDVAVDDNHDDDSDNNDDGTIHETDAFALKKSNPSTNYSFRLIWNDSSPNDSVSINCKVKFENYILYKY
ncbi:hypothetical protein IV203_025620 [Nitzschia inconspicua]|uniref:Uncharacterized protein n=1 Tax=Nitzschia inconspicua TaxID=303405 RepID=A0A9K3K499_9STRA|nr:hypothetical protein IV203_033430 [Nitzschia inconspicua]KAG7361954.1 hypothetical protein IV203_025620 [Nitzschia inconspicua]